MATIAVLTFIVGVVSVFYSIAMFLSIASQPEPVSLHLSQWSGYMATSDIQNRSAVVSSVSASWVVPDVTPSDNFTFSGVWVGIGGYGEDTLIQIGTEQEYFNGRPFYYAWYELLPDYLVQIPRIHVHPGDTIAASISLANDNENAWTITLSDLTRNENFEKTVVYNSSRLSAEWIVERPKVNGTVSTLADFGTVTFTDCKATIGGMTGMIGNFSYAKLVMRDEGTPLVSVSSLNSDNSVFTVSYLKHPSPTASANQLTENGSAQSGDAWVVYAKPVVPQRASRVEY
ncbi:MAG: G1 family glutamic endopeptidase [Candidatus Bathyarchaeia archaeon]